MQPASIPVERKGRRAKTDRIDLDMLLRTLLAWLRGEPRVCAMVRVPSEEEEDARRPGRERHKLTRERVSIENQIQSLLWLHGIYGFRARLKKAKEKLEALRMRSGASLPRETMAQLRRLMIRQRLLSEQLAEIDAAREAELAAAAKAPDPERGQRMIRLLVAICGMGLETATQLVREVLCRPFRDRRAVAAFVGLTGTPFPERGNGARAGRQQERRQAGPRPDDATGLALVEVSIGQRAEPLVRRAGRRRQGADPQDHGGGARAQAAGGAVALRPGRRHSGRRAPGRRVSGNATRATAG